MRPGPQDVSLIRQTLPFFLLCLLVVGVSLILSLSFPPSKALHPAGGPGSITNSQTSIVYFAPSRSLSDTTVIANNTDSESGRINSTIVVLSLSDDKMNLVVILGNMTYIELGPNRLLADSKNEGITWDTVPALMVTANPTTGVVLNVTKTNATDETMARLGLINIREMLVNQDVNAYDNITAKRSGGSEDCLYPDDVQGDVLCPKFYQESTPTTHKFRREYTESSAKGRRLLEDNFYNMSFNFETAVNAQTGLLEHANSSGTVSIAVHKSNNGTISTAVLAHNSSTIFDVQPGIITSFDLPYIQDLFDRTSFLPFNLSSPQAPTQNQTLEERELAKTVYLTKKLRLFGAFGVNMNAVTTMILTDVSLRFILVMDFGGFARHTLADRIFGEDVVRAIWQVLGLREFAKTKMEDLQQAVSAYVIEIENAMKTMIINTINEIKAKVATMKVEFINVSAQLQQEFNAYKAKMKALAGIIQAYFEKSITEGEKEIADLKLRADTEIADLKASLQSALDDYQNELRTVLNQIKQTEAEVNALQNSALNQTQLSQIAEYNKTLNDFSARRDEYVGRLSSANEEIAVFIDNQTAQMEFSISKTRASVDQQIADIELRTDAQIQQYSRNITATLDSYTALLDQAIANVTNIQMEINVANALPDSQNKTAKLAELNSSLNTFATAVTEYNGKIADTKAQIDAYVSQKHAEAAALINAAKLAADQTTASVQQEFNSTIASYTNAQTPTLEMFKSTIADATTKVNNATSAIDSVKSQLLNSSQQEQLMNFTTTLNQCIAERDKIKANIMNLKADITQYEIDKTAALEALIYTLIADANYHMEILKSMYGADQQDELNDELALVQSQLDDALATAQSETDTDIENFQNSKQTELSSLNNQLTAIISSIYDLNSQILNLKNSGYSPEIQAKLKQLDDQLTLYKARQIELEDFESGILDKIAKFVNQKKASMKAVVSAIQATIDKTQAKMDAITAGTFSWQAEFERFGLTVLSDILKPYKAAKENLDKAIDDVRIISGNLTTLVSESISGFKFTLSDSSVEISSSFYDIPGQTPTPPKGDANIFDFTFVDTILTSIKDTLKVVSSKITGVKDDLSMNVLNVTTDLLSVFKPEYWLNTFLNVGSSISSLENEYMFSATGIDINEAWLTETVGSLKSVGQVQLLSVDITSSASALSPTNTMSLLSSLTIASREKDKLITDYLNKYLSSKVKLSLNTVNEDNRSIGPAIPTPIGFIIIRWNYKIVTQAMVSIMLESGSFASKVEPIVSGYFQARLAWNVLLLEVGIVAGIGMEANLPCVVEMVQGKPKIATSVVLNYNARGQTYLYWKYIWFRWHSACWSIRIGRSSIRLCIYWPEFVWSSQIKLMGDTVANSGTEKIISQPI